MEIPGNRGKPATHLDSICHYRQCQFPSLHPSDADIDHPSPIVPAHEDEKGVKKGVSPHFLHSIEYTIQNRWSTAGLHRSTVESKKCELSRFEKFGVVLLAGVAICVFKICKPVWDFDTMESTARQTVKPAELQTWATNLLASYTNTTDDVNLSVTQLGTNFPRSLLKLAPRFGPYILVRPSTNQERAYV